MKEKLENLITTTNQTLSIALNDFIFHNRRVDRDRVIRLKTRVEVYEGLLKDLKTNKK